LWSEKSRKTNVMIKCTICPTSVIRLTVVYYPSSREHNEVTFICIQFVVNQRSIIELRLELLGLW